MFVSIEKKVFLYCTEKQLFKSGEEVVLGVSGGADSVCLLFVLYRLQKELGIRLHVVHVNHCIREDAKEDADYVEQLCRDMQVPFCYVERDVRELAATQKKSEEEVGRQVRYEAFEEEARRVNSGTIAVAHHKNDRAETMLFQLFRGSGITGMAGIREKRDCAIGKVVRPLLCLSREEIEAYLASMDVAFRTDSTNATDEYARNRIRHHILPYATENICSGTLEHLWNTAEVISELDDYLLMQEAEAEKRCVEYTVASDKKDMTAMRECVVQTDAFMEEHPAIRRAMIHELLQKIAGTAKDITYVHIQDVYNLCVTKGNRSICLPYGIEAQRSYQQVFLRKMDRNQKGDSGDFLEDVVISFEKAECREKNEICIELPGTEGEKNILQCRFFPYESSLKIPKETDCKWFDFDRVPERLQLRHRKVGDEIVIHDAGRNPHRKKVKDILINDKVPERERDKIWLLSSENQVLCILRGRISEDVKVSNQTKYILEIKIT